MTDIFSDFFEALKYNGWARTVVEMPFGSVVTLIADDENFDFVGDDINSQDEHLLKTIYIPECERIQRLKEIEDTVNHYLDFLGSYVCSDVLIGEDALSNEAFREWNRRVIHCDEYNVINGDTLLYVFDVSLFEKYDIEPEKKVFLIIENISAEEATVRTYHQYDDAFEKKFYIDFTYKEAPTYINEYAPDWVITKAIKETIISMTSLLIDAELGR